jgi:hypothetical protein
MTITMPMMNMLIPTIPKKRLLIISNIENDNMQKDNLLGGETRMGMQGCPYIHLYTSI